MFECLVDFELDVTKIIDSYQMYMGGVGQCSVFYVRFSVGMLKDFQVESCKFPLGSVRWY